VTDLDTLLRWVSGAQWLTILTVLLLPPCWRLIRYRPRPLDWLWATILLGVVNRLMFVGGADRTVSYIAAILMELLLALVIWSYQRADA
jgi:hypothetical protein